jgi:glycerate-2-kinase
MADMKIKNFDALAISDERRKLLTIAEAGLEAIDTDRVLRSMMRVEGEELFLGNVTVDLASVGKIIFIAIGKCAAEAAAVAEAVLGDRIARGVVVDVKVCPVSSPQIKTFCGTHPLPSEENMAAAEAIVQALGGLAENDLVIFVVSGGGSTLLFLPEDRRDRNESPIIEALMKAGANIHEMNVVRKHMSLARGGHLAQYAYPARVVSFIFSDVIGDDLSSIASGPTVKDLSTAEDAEKVLAKYNILRTCNIEKCGLVETPKDDKYFERTTNILAVSNVFALDAMKKSAEEIGFHVEIRGAALEGEAADVARMVAEAIHEAPPKSVLLWGGETTVTIHGTGNGGRNITVSAVALDYVKDGEEILSLASDGRDHGAYAGAICDTITKKDALKPDVGYETLLANNDTYALFEKIGHYLMTGDTGSNVSDLIIALKK